MSWESVVLGDVTDTLKGFAFKSTNYSESGIKIVRVSDFTSDSISDIDIKHYPKDSVDKYQKYLLKRDDVLIQTVGSWPNNASSVVGKVVKVPKALDGSLLNQNIVKIYPKSNQTLDNKFLYYCLKSDSFQDHNVGNAVGAANQASITLESIKTYCFNLPPLSIQRRIADILSAYDDLIENNQRQIKLLEEAAMRLYREWFVFMRFPGHEGVRIVDGVPEGWRQLPAHELFDITIGKTPPRVESRWFSTEIGDIKWISIRDMGDANIFIYNTGECLTKSAVEKFNLNLIPANTVVLSFKLTVGAVAITTENMFTNEAIAHFRINDDRMLEYTYEYLKNFSYKSLGNTSSISSAINSKIVKEMPFILPSKEVIDDFHKQMSPIFAEIRNKSMSIHLLQKARDALLPRLMNGGVGLKLEEEAV